MRRVPGSFDVDDLAHGLATLAAEILSCEVSEVDLSMEAPAPLAPAQVELGWAEAGDDGAVAEPTPEPVQEPGRAAAPAPRDTGDDLTEAEIDAEADAAADFLEGLLDAMDLSGDLKLDLRDGVIEVEVVDADSGSLIGRRGQTLESIQEMLRSSMQRQFQRRSRVVVDVEGYRRRRLEKFLEDAEAAIREVLDGDDQVRLEPMDVYERKQVHQLVATHEGLVSKSHGREPSRRVVIERA